MRLRRADGEREAKYEACPAVAGCDITGGVLSCSFATLAAGASIEINVSGKTSAEVCGKLDNTVSVAASNEANTGNNSANASITVRAIG